MITTDTVFAALPEDGSRITYGQLLYKLEVDEEDRGLVRAVLLVLQNQSRAEIEYGAGWYRTVEVHQTERWVVIRESVRHGRDWGVYDRETKLIAPDFSEGRAQAHLASLISGEVTPDEHWWRQPTLDEIARGEGTESGQEIIDDDGGRFYLVISNPADTDLDGYSIVDRVTGWHAWFSGADEGDVDWPLECTENLRNGEPLTNLSWQDSNGLHISARAVADRENQRNATA